MAPLGGDFSAKVAQANDRIICGSSVDAVKTLPMGRILARRLRIPFFQRRYCWSEPQWATLLRDVEACGGAGHALGRLTCAVEADGRLLVIDGQQRSTTCALLLAAVRDAPAADGALHARINNVLFPDGGALARWRASKGGAAAEIGDGEALDFAAVVPTHCDRAAFYEAVLPRGARAATSAWRRPAEAKAYFLDALARKSAAELGRLCDAIVDGLTWLLFPIRAGEGRADGTEDLFVIFERLARRDATFCRPGRAAEYASLGPADFARNRVLGSFGSERRAERVYEEAWLPIERAAADAAGPSRAAGAVLEAMLAAFLAREAPAPPPRRRAPPPSVVGGALYARFTRLMDDVLAAATDDAARERATRGLLRRLRAFAEAHFAGADDRPVAPAAAADALREDDEFEFPAPAPRRPSPRAVS